MYFSIIHKAVIAPVIVLLLCGSSYASVFAFLGAESGDTAECSFTTSTGTGTSIAADSSEVNSGGYGYKLVTGANVAANSACAISVGNTTASAVMDFYYRLDSAPATIAGNTMLMAHWDAQSVALGSVYLEMTAGAPSLQLVNRVSSVNVGTISINTGTWYRIVLAVTASAGSPVLTLNVCTVPANSCTTLSDTTDSTGTSNPGFAYMIEQTSATTLSSVTAHYDDQIVVLGSVADPGPHEVLARQFTGAGTYTGWAATGGGSCPANWNLTPYASGQPYCANSVSGAGTCAGGVTACETGVTHFDSTTGAGNTGHGSQTVNTAQTINAVKMGAFGFTTDSTVDSLVFINAAAAETDVAVGSAFTSVIGYREVYLASAPSAANLLGAQAGVKHAASTVDHHLLAMWLMADVNTTPSATTNAGGVINP